MKIGRGGGITGLCLIGMARVFAAPLTVIYDSGDTQPLAPLLEILGDPPEIASSTLPAVPSVGAADLKQHLPIRTPQLTPGAVERQRIKRPFTTPLFLIGSDPLSVRWLIQHRSQLATLGAIGLIVEVPDEATLNRLVGLAQGLNLMPASGADLADTLGLTHYPILITKDGISQ